MHSNTEAETPLAAERKWWAEKRALRNASGQTTNPHCWRLQNQRSCAWFPSAFSLPLWQEARLWSAKPLELSRKHVLILLCFVSTFSLSRLQAPFVINVSQTFRQLLLPAEQFRVYINPSKSRCLITRQPFHFFGGLSKKKIIKKKYSTASFIHYEKVAKRGMINWLPESRWSREVNEWSAAPLWSAVAATL